MIKIADVFDQYDHYQADYDHIDRKRLHFFNINRNNFIPILSIS